MQNRPLCRLNFVMIKGIKAVSCKTGNSHPSSCMCSYFYGYPFRILQVGKVIGVVHNVRLVRTALAVHRHATAETTLGATT